MTGVNSQSTQGRENPIKTGEGFSEWPEVLLLPVFAPSVFPQDYMTNIAWVFFTPYFCVYGLLYTVLGPAWYYRVGRLWVVIYLIS